MLADIDFLLSLLESMLRTSTPLILAAMGTLIAERSGVINLGIEGQILSGAFVGASVTYLLASPYMGLLAAVIAGALVAGILALACIEGGADQVVSGMALNILCMGAVPILGKIYFENTGSTPSIDMQHRVLYSPLLLAVLAPFLLWYLLKYSNWGLRLVFSGERSAAVMTAGYSVRLIRWQAYLLSGAMGGMAGWVLSVFLSSGFSRGMSGGRGFIALAAMIMGRWQPLPTALVCLFFGLSEAVQIQLQGLVISGHKVPVQFIQILPYFLALVVVGGFMVRSKPPANLGSQL